MPVLAIVCIALLLLCLPFALAALALAPASALAPMADPTVIAAYQQGVSDFVASLAAQTTPGKPLPQIDWRQVLVVEAVRRQQQLTGLTVDDARRLAALFVEKRTETKQTCLPGLPICTTETVTWYEALPFDQVLERLRFDANQRQWAYTMLANFDSLVLPPQINVADAGGDTGGEGCAPPGWQPRPLAGWTWPLPGHALITSCFGSRIDPVTHVPSTHTGVDIAAPLGTPVYAARPGIVTDARWDGNYGQVVRISHPDGTLTVYGHLSRILAVRGQRVAAGDLIGLVGSTGKSTGPHLHFEVRSGGRPLNPLAYYGT